MLIFFRLDAGSNGTEDDVSGSGKEAIEGHSLAGVGKVRDWLGHGGKKRMSEGHSLAGAGEGGKTCERAREAALVRTWEKSELARGSLGISSSPAPIAPQIECASALGRSTVPLGEGREMHLCIRDGVTCAPPSLIIVGRTLIEQDVTAWQCWSHASPNEVPQSGVTTISGHGTPVGLPIILG